jgi:quinohemoprotein amine dehydrogenase
MVSLAFGALFAGIVSSQPNDPQSQDGPRKPPTTEAAVTPGEEGTPVSDPLVIAKCGSCHARDARGNMQHISWERATPESWQDALKQMILLNGLSVTPPEARSIVKYLSKYHGVAPQEAKPVMYFAERRIRDETDIPNEDLRDACTKCHAFARALSWRRSSEDWKQFMDSHAVRYKIAPEKEAAAVAYLVKAAPLHTTEWDTWSSRPRTPDLTGRWLVAAHSPGRGNYYGEMQIDRAGDDEYTTRVNLKSVADGSIIVRSGNSAVFGGYSWRGRSRGSKPENFTPDDPSSEAREVMWIAPDQTAAEGRWFWGQYQEFEIDVTLRRASSGPTLLVLNRSSL